MLAGTLDAYEVQRVLRFVRVHARRSGLLVDASAAEVSVELLASDPRLQLCAIMALQHLHLFGAAVVDGVPGKGMATTCPGAVRSCVRSTRRHPDHQGYGPVDAAAT